MSDDEEEESKSKKAKKPKKKGGKLFTFMLILGSLTLIVLTQMTYVFIIIGILPSIVAYYVDTTANKSTFHTVFACNMSGVLPFVVKLIDNGNRTSEIQSMLSDMEVLFIMYISAAFGWVLVKGMPYCAALLISGLNERQISKYKGRQKDLIKEWGPDVANYNQEH